MPAKDDVTARLLSEFSDMLARGELKPGQRLPAERDLAIRFRTSRSSLRPVMKVLESVGVLVQRVGDGSFLSSDASGILRLPLTFLILLEGVSPVELMEARLMVEPEMAARAAECAASEDLAAMRQSLGGMLADTVGADLAFHDSICKATRNRICYRMFGTVHRAFEQCMAFTSQLAPPDRALQFHKEIYSAIHMQKPDQARQKMKEHLLDAKALVLQACLEHDLLACASKGQGA